MRANSVLRLIGRPSPRLCRRSLLVAASALLAMPAIGAEYPDRPVCFITAGLPGGTTDILARMIGASLTDAFRKQIVIDNRAGGGGVVAADLAAKAAPDGYTLLMTYHAHTVNASLVPKLPYRPVDDFTPITQVTSAALALVVHPSAPANNVREFVEWLRSHPGPISFGSAGNGSGGHLAGELLKVMTGIKAQHVPYKASTAALIDLTGNRYQFSFTGMQTAQAFLKGGRLKAVGVTSLERVPVMPDVPSVNEVLPGFEVVGWYGLLGPAGLPAPVLKRIHTEVVRIVETPGFRERVRSQGAQVVTNTPEKFREFLRADVAKWAKVLEDSGAKLD